MLRLRHECKSKYITKVNEKLTELQRSEIQKTPFKWLLSLPKKLKISENLLEELVERWDDRSGGFAIQGRIIRFTPLDVCFALGLRIIGEKVNFKNDPTSTTKAMFDNEVINVKTIYAKIINMERDEDVEKFCRFYLLLGFAEFYFPNSSVKVWALEHVIEELSATKEEVANEVVREALDRAPSGYIKWRPDPIIGQLIVNNRLLGEANKGLSARMSLLESETREMKKLYGSAQSSYVDEGVFNDEGVHEDVSMDEIERVIEREVANVSYDVAHHASNLLTIIKDKPRNRVKSGVLLSPWVKDGRIKKKI
ncbi:hypothetical protein MTR_1g050140 [Medicago truncatula]|uniref:Uncharacterized protein n=1 Tax=Medicago truncatula TaxID=3880 RepID=G7I7A2_MEDTR|nr:hypothetical protein MTR_1g050140 [Medicago truncatula]